MFFAIIFTPMAKPATQKEDPVALYTALVKSHPDAVLKGKTMPYTSVNGNMYSYISKERIVALRLPEPLRSEFIGRYKTSLMQAYGIVQKEYVAVPDGLLQKTDELKKYFDVSYEYVSSLKPKPTTRKK
jgi:hypothetical protein